MLIRSPATLIINSPDVAQDTANLRRSYLWQHHKNMYTCAGTIDWLPAKAPQIYKFQ